MNIYIPVEVEKQLYFFDEKKYIFNNRECGCFFIPHFILRIFLSEISLDQVFPYLKNLKVPRG